MPFAGNGNAKVLIGIRRSGKSTLLRMMADSMGPGIDAVFLDMERWQNRSYRDPDALYGLISGSLAGGGRGCLFIDEVQDVREWESVIRSLIAERRCDVYLSGSNSRLLSGEFATFLSGRVNALDVFTLTFSECLEFEEAYRGPADREAVFDKFLRFGGFPNVWRNDYAESQAHSEISDITDAIIKRDIADRHGVRNTEVLDRILSFICDNVGNPMSVNNIFASLRSEDGSIGRDMVYDYVGYLEESCLIVKAPAYDVKGRKHLTSKYKYYLSDIGIKSARLGFRPDDISGYMENILYLELRSRGYDVWVGDCDGRAIDLVGEMNGKKVYVQATSELSGEETVRREFGSLRGIDDNHPKYVVTLRDGPLNADIDGIRCRRLIDFLEMREF
jgi:predicted AAA+ superfamily ATPase